ncbi:MULTISPECIES: energy-coupling factor transporter transmembrane component T [unclassified Thalassospira]|uniref:energy-coupling factor transporter transmembrane component T family protein n=1 Tax=unclassified Thalassospira TaxID=2648997 RepID=UPI0007A56DE8|nr:MULTISPECIES: energy-coupling factor transporter transmembrane component T [unclassified Thalassospira]KZD02539.1 cobalt ABC transporter permease [Thalassospira sp. MCCC 1A02898]ONH88893.1 cobalt ABC transporter permease [Thalassospira sp. MCCC 1A02803]
MIAGLYIHGQSALHRAAAGAKILAMVALGTGVFLIPDWSVVAFVLATVLLLYPASGFGPRIMWAQIKSILWLLVIFFAVQLWLNDWQAGLLVVTRIAAIVMFASLVTLTTKTSDLLASLERAMQPLRPIGVNPEKVSLAISMVLRFIPVISTVASEIRDAQRARGLDRSIVAMVVPLIIRTLKMADDVADAIDARSFD